MFLGYLPDGVTWSRGDSSKSWVSGAGPPLWPKAFGGAQHVGGSEDTSLQTGLGGFLACAEWRCAQAGDGCRVGGPRQVCFRTEVKGRGSGLSGRDQGKVKVTGGSLFALHAIVRAPTSVKSGSGVCLVWVCHSLSVGVLICRESQYGVFIP